MLWKPWQSYFLRMILHWALRSSDWNAVKNSTQCPFPFQSSFFAVLCSTWKWHNFLGNRKQLGWTSQHQSSASNRKQSFPETHHFHTKRHNCKVMKNEVAFLKNYWFSLARTVLSLQQGPQQKRCHFLSSSFQRKEKVGKRKSVFYS